MGGRPTRAYLDHTPARGADAMTLRQSVNIFRATLFVALYLSGLALLILGLKDSAWTEGGLGLAMIWFADNQWWNDDEEEDEE